MDLGDAGCPTNVCRSGENGSEKKGSPSRGRSATLISVDAEAFAETMAVHEELRRLAEVARAENKRLVEEKGRLEGRIMSYQRQVADLTAESRQIYLDASNDRMNLERSWQDMNKYKKESERCRKRAMRAEAESARHAKKVKETAAKMEALVEDLSLSERKRLALEEWVIREYPSIDLSFLETEEFRSPLLVMETRAAETLPVDGEGTIDATKSPPKLAEKVETSQLDIWEREASRLAADRGTALWPPWPIGEETPASSTAEGTHRFEDWPCRGMGQFNRA